MNTTTTARRLTYADLRTDPAYMVFWDAINEGRAKAGQPEALYANVRDMWDAAMVPTLTEVNCAARRHLDGYDYASMNEASAAKPHRVRPD